MKSTSNSLRSTLLGLLLSALPVSSYAALDAWTMLGPDQAKLVGLAIDPVNDNILYAAGTRSVYKSTNGGNSWSYTELDSGSFFENAKKIHIDPADTDRIFLLRNAPALTLSEDGGASWNTIDTIGVTGGDVAFDPADSDTIFITSQSATSNHLIRTIDGGANWAYKTTGLPAHRIRSITIDPSDADKLWLSIDSGITDLATPTIYRSTDGGDTWDPATTGPTYTISMTTYNAYPTSVVVSPTNGNLLYALSGRSIYKSIDAGDNWVLAHEYPDMSVTTYSMMFDPDDSTKLIIVGQNNSNLVLLTSTITDDTNWALTNTDLSGTLIEQLQRHGMSSRLIATTSFGFFYSDDEGASWTRSSNGLSRSAVDAVAVNPNNQRNLFAVSGGLFESNNGGANWNALYDSARGSVAIDPNDTDNIYVGRNDGAARSTDGGTSWTELPSLNSVTNRILIHPDVADTVFIISGGKLYRTTDGGTTVVRLLNPGSSFDAIALDPLDSDVVYATYGNSTSGETDIFRSSDRGASWEGTVALPTPYNDAGVALTSTDPNTLVINPTDNTEMFISAANGIYRSMNGGVDWAQVDTGTSRAVAYDPVEPNRIYAGTFFNGMRESTDSGTTWNPVFDGIDPELSTVSQILVSPHNNERVYATTSSNGLVVKGPGIIIRSSSGTLALPTLLLVILVFLGRLHSERAGCKPAELAKTGRTS